MTLTSGDEKKDNNRECIYEYDIYIYISIYMVWIIIYSMYSIYTVCTVKVERNKKKY